MLKCLTCLTAIVLIWLLSFHFQDELPESGTSSDEIEPPNLSKGMKRDAYKVSSLGFNI